MSSIIVKILKRKNLWLCIIFLALSCASHKQAIDDQKDNSDALEYLLHITERSASKDEKLSTAEIEKLTAEMDSLCNSAIRVSGDENLLKLRDRVDKTKILHSVLVENTDHANVVIPYQELRFRLLVTAQHQMKAIFENENTPDQQNKNSNSSDGYEVHGNWVFKEKVSYMLPYLQANRAFSKEKTMLLLNLMETLPRMEHRENRLRTWLAINRMVNEINLQKSSSGYEPFQRSAEGIFANGEELLTTLKALHDNEPDETVRVYSEPILAQIESNLNQKEDREFSNEVEWFQELNQRFKEDVSVNFGEPDSSFLAFEWFDKGEAANDDLLKIEYYSKTIQCKPNYTPAFFSRGFAFQNLGRYEQALQDFGKAIELKPGYAPAYMNRGNVYQLAGMDDKAILDFTQAITLQSNYSIAYNQRAVSHKKLGNFETAILDLNEAINLEPNYATAYFNRGDLYRHLKRDEEAIADYTWALKLDPNFAQAYNNRGVSYKNIKNYKQAIADHQKAIEIFPDFDGAYYNLGCVYWLQREWKKVIQAWETCLQINPNHHETREWLPKAKKASEPRIIKKKIYVFPQ